MPNNQIDSFGIQVQTLAEIINDVTNGTPTVPGFKQIYGDDISVESNTPDGQMINIFALSKADILDLIVQDFNSKDPDQAIGVAWMLYLSCAGFIGKGGHIPRSRLQSLLIVRLILVGLMPRIHSSSRIMLAIF